MIWNRLAKKYDSLWVQKYSLKPTRDHVMGRLASMMPGRLVDIGCGTGQLLNQISKTYPQIELTGIDKAEEMIRQCRKKNVPGRLICADIGEMEPLAGKFDTAVCCHSFPYYKNKSKIIETVHGMLNETGRAIFVQASENTWYDKLALWVVERTAEEAEYLSVEDFCRLSANHFEIEERFTIRERWFMPSICGFVLKKI